MTSHHFHLAEDYNDIIWTDLNNKPTCRICLCQPTPKLLIRGQTIPTPNWEPT